MASMFWCFLLFIGHDATNNTGCTYKVISYGAGAGIWTRVRRVQSNRSTIWAIILWQLFVLRSDKTKVDVLWYIYFLYFSYAESNQKIWNAATYIFHKNNNILIVEILYKFIWKLLFLMMAVDTPISVQFEV